MTTLVLIAVFYVLIMIFARGVVSTPESNNTDAEACQS